MGQTEQTQLDPWEACGLELLHRSDPLAFWRTKSKAQRDLIHYAAAGIEVYFHAGNQAGKTTSGCALDVALLQGRRELAGIKLPRIEMPASGALIVPSHKVGEGSSIQAIKGLLGSWPYEIATTGGKNNFASLIYVKPIGWADPDYRTWSKLYVFPHEGEIPEGLRLDFAHADEPPPMNVWDAIRFRGRGGDRPFLLYITATPIQRRFWDWLMQPDQFEAVLNAPADGRVRIQSTVFDNEALTKADKRDLRRKARGSPWEKARLNGDHIDASGDCPFDYLYLKPWEERCVPPRAIVPVEIQAMRRTRHGTRKFPRVEEFKQWAPVETDEVYYIPIDPSGGIRSAEDPKKVSRRHDPSAFHVYALRNPRLVATFTGPLEPYGLGYMACIVGWYYNTALIDPEMNAGWGEGVLAAAGELEYPNLATDINEEGLGKSEPRFGFRTHRWNRGDLISAVQGLTISDGVLIEDLEVIRCLFNIVLVPDTERAEAAKQRHDEHMILLGRFGVRAPTIALPPLQLGHGTHFERQLEKEMGVPMREREPEPFAMVGAPLIDLDA